MFLLVWGGAYIDESFVPVVLGMMTLVSIGLMIAYRNHHAIMVFHFFQSTYVLILIPYFVFGIPIVPYIDFQIPRYMNSTLLIHALFIMVFYLSVSRETLGQKKIFRNAIPQKHDPFIFFSLLLVMLVFIFSLGGQNIYTLNATVTYDAYVQNSANASGAYEYFYVLFIVAFCFAKKKQYKMILLGIYLFYAYFAITRGFRIQLLQLTLLVFLLFVDGKFKLRTVVILAVAGLVSFQAFGFLKEGKYELGQLFAFSTESGQIMTNQSEVFYTTNVINSAIIDGVFGIKERLVSIGAATLQILIPPRFGFIEGKPALYLVKLEPRDAGGGGLISGFFYFWGSFIGVVLIAMFIAKMTNKAILSNSRYLAIFVILMYSLYPRWLAYDPVNSLFRLPLYAIALYVIAMSLHKYILMLKSQNKASIVPASSGKCL